MPNVGMICGYLDRFAPPELAADWDNVGLLLGDPNTEVQRVLTCLTLSSEVADEAIEQGAQLIVTHHPILFRATKRLCTTSSEGRRLWALARAGIAVYSPHTSFDNCNGGINDMLSQRLDLTDIKPLRRRPRQQVKIVVFTPDADLVKVSEAMFAAGAGIIGKYSQCSYRLPGTGTFFGSEDTNPTVGQKGRREEVSEWRLEVICPTRLMDSVLQAMRRNHSYEEPAFDVYPLQPVPGDTGEGRVGKLESPLPLGELANRVKQRLDARSVQIVGEKVRVVERIAIACGAAGEFLNDAVRAKADVFLTGEMRFHDYLQAQEKNVALLLPGHYASERPAIEDLAVKLAGEWPGLAVWASRRETDPIEWV